MELSYLSLSVAIVSTAMSQFLLKLFYVSQKRRFLLVAIGMFACIPIFSYLALKHLQLSTVYVSTAITQVLVLGLARVLLQESISRDKFKGIVLILVGIIIFAL